MAAISRIWYVGVALAALGRQAPARLREPFTRSELGVWADFKRGTLTGAALTQLATLGFVRAQYAARGNVTYLLTDEGVAAAKSATDATARQAHGQRLLAINSARTGTSPFAQRLWNLLRVRKALTSVEAANLLSDAGDDTANASAREQAATYLRTWSKAHPQAIQVSARRISHAKRYVLIEDLGIQPPSVSTRRVPTKRGTPA